MNLLYGQPLMEPSVVRAHFVNLSLICDVVEDTLSKTVLRATPRYSSTKKGHTPCGTQFQDSTTGLGVTM